MTVHLTKGEVAGRAVVAQIGASAVILPTGEALLLMSGSGQQVPETGMMQIAGESLAWEATVFCRPGSPANQWSAIALVPTLPRSDSLVFEADGPSVWGVNVATRVSVSASDLIARAQEISADTTGLFRFLVRQLDRCREDCAPQERAFRAFTQEFLDAVAVHDGFIELMAEPETKGLLLQGWAQSLRPTPVRWISLAEPLADPDMTIAFFDRPDLLSPARGVCLFHKDLRLPESATGSTAYLEQDGRLLRLDLVARPMPSFEGAAANEHVARMISRLQGPQDVLASFQRICRPLFKGEDTLTPTRLPLGVGLDVVLRAPDGALLIVGWLLDPDSLVDMVLIKSRSDRYARMNEDWVRLPRPDLAQAFAEDPRFAGRLGKKDTLSGFIVRVPPGPDPETLNEDLYLELVLQDHRCFFRPLEVTAPCSIDGLRRLLTGISPSEPELARVIDDHLVPILAAIRGVSPVKRPSRTTPLISLGRPRDPASVVALMPFTSFDELQPIFALLAGTPEARQLDLTLIAPRRVVEEVLDQLHQAFRFYGLAGHVLPATISDLRTALFDAALDSATAAHVLVWSPQALPKTPGWLACLVEEMAGLARPGVISPLLTYEDGSIRFGPPTSDRASSLGFTSGRLERSGATEVPAAAADITLIPRDQLVKAGGFSGHLFSDVLAHIDLSMRISATGGTIWCSGRVKFWCLDDPAAQDTGGPERILQRVDARLLVQRGASDLKEQFP